RAGVRRARREVPAARRCAQRGERIGLPAQRSGHPATLRAVDQNRQPACRTPAGETRRVAGGRRTFLVPALTGAAMVLRALQDLLAAIYDVPLAHDVYDFLVTDPGCVPGAERSAANEEQLLVARDGDDMAVALFLDA